jgi:hypothetical protein
MDILDAFKQLSKSSIATVGDVFRLAKLELQLAKRSAMAVVILSLLMVLLATAIWIFLVALLLVHLVSVGVSVQLSLLVAIGLHLLLAIIAALLIKHYSGHLTFAATRRQLH